MNNDPTRLPIRVLRKFPQPVKEIMLRIYWPLKAFGEDFQDFTAEMIGNIPSHTLRLFWLKKICGMKIGKGSSVHRRCRMYHPYKINIGNYSTINYGVLLDGRRGLQVCDNVNISEGVVILTLGHDIDDPSFALKGGEVVISDYVFIGSYARILPGVHLGTGAVVAAGAVVTRNVEPFTMVAGVPAKFVRNRSRNLVYQIEYKRRFG